MTRPPRTPRTVRQARPARRVPEAAAKPAAPAGEAPIALLERGDLDGARRRCEEILARAPEDLEAMEALGLVELRQGRPASALERIREVARRRPGNRVALGNLCAVLVSLRRYDEAMHVADEILVLDPGNAEACTTRGIVLQMRKDPEAALDCYRRALARQPMHGDAANNAGILLGELGRHEEALRMFDIALAARPGFAEGLNNRAVSLAALGREEEALRGYRAAVAARPGYVDAQKNLAELLSRMARYEEAIVEHDALLALVPGIAELVSNRAIVLHELDRHGEALAEYDRALAMKPDFVDALNNRGIALSSLGRLDEALESFRRAEALKPDYANAYWNESLALLRLGRFAEGWAKHEWRWQKPEFLKYKLDLPFPRWTGREDLRGRSILLLAEQGFGDTLQFARYIPMLEARGAKVLFFAPEPVVPLLAHSFPRATIFHRAKEFPACDYQCPLLSLPLAFGTLLETVPAQVPYLSVPRDVVRQWATGLEPPETLKVGLVWSGSATHKNDRHRSLPLDAFAKLLELPGIRWYSLQKDVRPADAARLAGLPQILPVADDLRDFADTAALVSSLDLVIAVDTAVAHLAGALGRPVWILLPQVSDWRWLPGRETTPWYPTARLFWQSRTDGWQATFERLRSELGAVRDEHARRGRPAPPPITADQAVEQASALLASGNRADAEAICQGVLLAHAEHFGALMVLGALRLQQGDAAGAVDIFRRATVQQPRAVDAQSNLAGALRLADRPAEALEAYDRAIAIAPQTAVLHANRGIALITLRRFEDAIASIDRALEINPRHLGALNNRGVALNELRRPEDAMACFDRALAIQPGYPDALNNRGLSLMLLERFEEAEVNYRRLLAAHPRFADGISNLGLVLAGLCRNREAIDCFRRAQALKPGYVDAHWNEALIDLVEGDFARGWQLYEWRWKKPEYAPHHIVLPIPEWSGREPVEGRTVFVHAEQGYGDTIQFVRYAELLRRRGAKVLVSLPPSLRELMRASYPDIGFYCGGETLPPFDLHVSMLSLPRCFGTDLASIPAPPGYLRAPAEAAARWRARLGPRDRPRIGIAWSGNPKHLNDRNRSLPAAALPRILVEGVRWFSLQRDVREADEAAIRGLPLEPLGPQLADFSDTAAAIAELDLVISVDTSVAHLAAALGKPTWILLPFAPDWRWLMHREDSPWYPSVRLFRQPARGAFDAVLDRLRAELERWMRKGT